MENTGTINLAEWVESFSEELYSWALYKISDPETAKDLVQDTFLAAAEKIDGFKGDSSPKTWLFAILKNKIIDIYRKKVKQPVKQEEQFFSGFFDEGKKWKAGRSPREWQEEESHLLDNDDFMAVLKRYLDELPEKWNACVQLKFMENKLTFKVIQIFSCRTVLTTKNGMFVIFYPKHQPGIRPAFQVGFIAQS